MISVTAEQMAEIDKRAQAEYGISQALLMENAGKAVFDEILKTTPDISSLKIAIICGKGNNGGDGFVAARYLNERAPGAVMVYASDPEDMREGAARDNMDAVASLMDINPLTELLEIPGTATIYVDALFGTGFSGEIKGLLSKVVDKINSTASMVYAVDIPSGLNATTGTASVNSIKASTTVTFGAAKKGFFLEDGPGKCGEIIVADIGFPKELLEEYA